MRASRLSGYQQARRILLPAALLLGGCGQLWPRGAEPEPSPPPEPPRVDTVTIVREVPPPLPEAREVELCLSTGYPARVWITPTGDTLVADRKVNVRELRPGLQFEGTYAEGRTWYTRGQPIRFERRDYRKSGVEGTLECEGLKEVGTHDGVPLFADLLEVSPVRTIHLPVRPGVFQSYIRR